MAIRNFLLSQVTSFRRYSQINFFTCAYSSLSHFESSETYHLKSIHKMNFVYYSMTHFTDRAQDFCFEIQRQTVSFNILAVAFYVPAPPSEDTNFFSDNSLPVWRCCHKQSNPNSKLAHFTQFLITLSNSEFDNHWEGTLAPQVRNVNSHSRKFLGVMRTAKKSRDWWDSLYWRHF